MKVFMVQVEGLEWFISSIIDNIGIKAYEKRWQNVHRTAYKSFEQAKEVVGEMFKDAIGCEIIDPKEVERATYSFKFNYELYFEIKGLNGAWLKASIVEVDIL